MTETLVEVVCCSIEDVASAVMGGAGRIELCCAISEGGLTPSFGLLKPAEIPQMVMIRPRAGGFCYSNAEIETMKADIGNFEDRGAEGFVFMVLNDDGTVNCQAVKDLKRSCAQLPLVCHRAFDVTPDPFMAMEQLIDLGFSRILTSGQQRTALDGAQLIRRLIETADGRIEILPGGGIRPDNVRSVVLATGANQVHLAPWTEVKDPTSNLGGPISYGSHTVLTLEEVRATVDALKP